MIRRVHVNKYFVVIERGEKLLERKTMGLETFYYPRGLLLPWGKANELAGRRIPLG